MHRKFRFSLLLVFVLFLVLLGGCGQTDNNSLSSVMESSQPSAASASSVQASSNISSSSSSASVSSAFTAQVSDLCTQAQVKYNALSYKDAIKLCDEAIGLDANCYIAYNIKGVALCYEKDYTQGMQLIEKSLQINPDYAYGRFNMAMGYKLQKDLDNALIWFNKALEVKPNDAWTFYGISTIYADKNDIPDSLKYLKMAVDLDASVKPVAKSQDHFIKMRSNPDFIKIVS
jgi:tetratricopeptide (TPR) repeat protein